MSRKHNVNEINLQIDNIDFWGTNQYCNGGMRIYWSSDIGYGTLDIVKESGNDGEDYDNPREKLEIVGFTEYMDSNDDKEFTRKLMSLLVDKLNIVD